MKKYIYLVFLFGIFFFSGCTDQPSMTSIVTEIQTSIVFPGSTTQDLTFPTQLTLSEATVFLSWQSDNEQAIDSSGRVYPGLSEKQAHIQAVVTYQDDKTTIDFGIIKVPAWEEEDIIELIKQQLTIPNTTNIDVTLPNSIEIDQTILPLTWTSALPNVLSSDGVVNLPSVDTAVLLSISTVINSTPLSFPYKEIVVLAISREDAIERAQSQISLPSTTNTDINLPKNIDGVTIAWFSDHPDVFTNKGEWKYGPQDTDVILTAVFSYQDLFVEGYYPIKILTYTAEERLQMAASTLSLPATVEQNLELQVAFAYEVIASWSSTHPQIINSSGVVSLSETAHVVTLTATLMIGESTMEKQFTVTTKALNQSETHFSSHMYTHRLSDFLITDHPDLIIENEKVVLKSTSIAGTYQSRIISTSPFTRLVGSWSALSSQEATVELKIRVRVNDVWSNYLSYSAWGFGRQNAMFDQNGGVASMNDDEIIINNSNQANAFQFQITLRRNSLASATPKLWLVGVALTIPDYVYSVDTTNLPNFIDYDVPKLYQHDVPTIGGSICSITSSTMLLMYYKHQFSNPLPHQETSPLFKDYGNNIYGNWVFNTVGISSYGETSYVKKIYSWDELKYHLVNVGPVAVSIKGNTGLYTTNGHLIVVRGYEIIGQETFVITNDPNLKSVYYKYPLATFLGFTRNVLYIIE